VSVHDELANIIEICKLRNAPRSGSQAMPTPLTLTELRRETVPRWAWRLRFDRANENGQSDEGDVSHQHVRYKADGVSFVTV